MKPTFFLVSVLAVCLLFIPMMAVAYKAQIDVPVQAQVHSPMPPQSQAVPPVVDVQDSVDEPVEEIDEIVVASDETAVTGFKILDQTTGEVHEVSLQDFVRGAVAAEMPAAFHSEALKAQAVAAHTYALYNHLMQQKNPDPALKGADFAADPSNMKVYITEEKAQAFYGDNADLYWNKICVAADSVVNEVLKYEDEPIIAAYHAICAGQTEDAANVWSGSLPYLQPVQSQGDLLAPGYESTVTFTKQEVRDILQAAYPAMELEDDPAAWFAEPQRSDSGYVTLVGVGNQELQGKDVRTLFDLRSHDFEVTYLDGIFTFTVFGYGHGIGLSQYGADFMARQGMTYDEILNTYYTGVTLARLQD